jgi:hypothetical protein
VEENLLRGSNIENINNNILDDEEEVIDVSPTSNRLENASTAVKITPLGGLKIEPELRDNFKIKPRGPFRCHYHHGAQPLNLFLPENMLYCMYM